MCNIFSGHIIAQKDHKDWGKVIFLSGIHHEKDREKIYKKYKDNNIRLVAWESKEPYSLDEFKFTHAVNVSVKEQKEFMKLLKQWAKKQSSDKLLRSMITVLKDNKKTEDYKVINEMIKTGNGYTISCDFSVNVVSGKKSTQTAGDESTQTAGSWSTQTAGDGSTCIIYGDTSYVILEGKNVLLTQIYSRNGKSIRKKLNLDDLFKKYKKGDKIKIVKGKAVEKVI